MNTENHLEGINSGALCEAAHNKSCASSQITDNTVTFSNGSGNKKQSQVGVLLICTALP